jgi:endogenous inhibitor of DNA gyrase (YacG/DUF329 family)
MGSGCICTHCGKEVDPDSQEWRRFKPFCSERCRLADLDRWFEGEYRIPGKPLEEHDTTAEEPGQK